MEKSGLLKLKWTQGCCQGTVSYVTVDKMCFACGDFIRVCGIEDDFDSSFPVPGDGLGCLTAKPDLGVIAVSELCLQPAIHVVKYSSFDCVSKLTNGTEIEYVSLIFTGFDYLVSVGSAPDYSVILWKWRNGEKLYTTAHNFLAYEPLSLQISVNPSLWFQLCFQNAKGINILEIESYGERVDMQQRVIYLPVEGDRTGESTLTEKDVLSLKYFDDTSEKSWGLYTDVLAKLPLASVGELDKSEVLDFYDYHMHQKRITPSCHCWLPHGDIIVACHEGTVIKINGETLSVCVVHNFDISSDTCNDTSDPVTSLVLHRDGLYVGKKDGLVELYDIAREEWLLTQQINVGQSVADLIFSPDYDKLAITTNQGSIFIHSPRESKSLRCAVGSDNTAIVGISALQPESQYCVTANKSGLLQVWNINTGQFVSRLYIEEMAETLVCSPLCSLVTLGSATGFVYFIDATDVSKMRIIHVMRPFDTPVTQVKQDNYGQYIVLGAKKWLYILNGFPTSDFLVLGCRELEETIKEIALFRKDGSDNTTVLILASDLCSIDNSGDVMVRFELPCELPKGSEMYKQNEFGIIREEPLQIKKWKLANAGLSLALHSDLGAFVFSPTTHKLLILPVWDDTSDVLSPSIQYDTKHELDGCSLVLSSNHQWLASINSDGKLCVYNTSKLDSSLKAAPHSFWQKGGTCVCFSAEKNLVVSGGDDGSIVCHEWKLRTLQKDPAVKWVSWCKVNSELENSCLARAEGFEEDISLMSTWLDEVQKKAEEINCLKYYKIRDELQNKMNEILKKLEGLMEENDQLPLDSQLPLTDFALDRNYLKEQLSENNKRLKVLRAELEEELKNKQEVAASIKEECWDAMNVRGKALKAFHTDLVVYNYPLKERTQKELDELHRVQQQREIDIQGEKMRQKILEGERQTTVDIPPDNIEEKGAKVSGFTGSLRMMMGVDSPLLYSQFHLQTKEQKINQSIMLQDVIYRVKQEFNKKFTLQTELKRREIARIKERNSRIHEINSFFEEEEELWKPVWDEDEIPEKGLIVKEDEIKSERFLTEEEIKRALEEKEREEKRRQEQSGGMREIALENMMGGTLESRKEDELKKDPTPPAFMVNKSQAEWTKDEHQLAREYEKKLMEVREEREKFQRNLKTEFEKLKTSIRETSAEFDSSLQNLFEQKILCDFIVYQEELKIFIMTFSLIVDDELNKWEEYLQDEINRRQQYIKWLNSALSYANEIESSTKELYEEIQAQERHMEGNGKRECIGIHSGEALYRAFRKRPRFRRSTANESPNPYGTDVGDLKQQELESALVTLDAKSNCPEGVQVSMWKKICDMRKQKILMEEKLKQQSLEMAKISAVVQKREKDLITVKEEVESLEKTLKRVHKLRLRCLEDLPVLMIMKQGFVEVDFPEMFPDFSSAVLVPRAAVDSPNENIRSLGERKFAAMSESQSVRHEIKKLLWDQKRLQMEVEDLDKLLREIQTFRVTRDMRRYLDGDTKFGPDTKINALEKSIELQNEFFSKQKSVLVETYDHLERERQKKARENQEREEEFNEVYTEVCELRLLCNPKYDT